MSDDAATPDVAGRDAAARAAASRDVTAAGRRRAVTVAGHRGDGGTARAHLADADPLVRVAALGALARTGELTTTDIEHATADTEPMVRRRAAELAGEDPGVSLLGLLSDDDPDVVEVAAWACGEQERVGDDVLAELVRLTTESDDALVREAAAAALGAIGDERGLPAILAACDDQRSVRRRAVLALAPFSGPDVDAAITRALDDRDWQVRQAAEDLTRAAGEYEL